MAWVGLSKKVGQSCYLRSRAVRPRRQSGLYDTNMGGPKSLSFFIDCPIRENDAPTKKEILLLATPPSDCKTNTRVLPDTHTLVERRGGSKTNICESFRTSSSSSFSKRSSCYLCTYATPSLFFAKPHTLRNGGVVMVMGSPHAIHGSDGTILRVSPIPKSSKHSSQLCTNLQLPAMARSYMARFFEKAPSGRVGGDYEILRKSSTPWQ